ncbi:MAG: hypothetical protein IT537_30580 [Hyphomicrobiales bacterium]|nr:hypothetical protein [Hyphomicrobiales bacterium]
MAKIEVKGVRAVMTQGDMEPHWLVRVSYGATEVEFPLPARQLITDDWSQSQRDWTEAMESLARALLDFAAHTRRRFPTDFD